MDKNNFRYCTLLLINDDNHSKIFISEKNKYYIKSDNKSIHIKILNEFKDIRKSYRINVDDITDNYYKIDKFHIIKNCTIWLIDDDDHSKIFISEKHLSYTSNDCYNFGVDVDDYELFDEDYEFFDEDYEDYSYYDDNYDDDYDDYYYKEVDDDDDDDFYNKLYYKKPFNYFEHLVSVKNNTVNLINNDNNHKHNITLLVDNINIFIIENVY